MLPAHSSFPKPALFQSLEYALVDYAQRLFLDKIFTQYAIISTCAKYE